MTLNAIIANFQTFKLVDLLDIIIISFLIYQLLGIVNRTRAGQLFKRRRVGRVSVRQQRAHAPLAAEHPGNRPGVRPRDAGDAVLLHHL